MGEDQMNTSSQDSGKHPVSALLGAECKARSMQTDFLCAICQRNVDMRWNHLRKGREDALPPICKGCEHNYSQGVGKPIGGTFRDRREVMRGMALAEALRCAAASQDWVAAHG